MNQRDNPLFSLLFNIIIPVVILNKGADFFNFLDSSQTALLVLLCALAFPVLYGSYDLIKHKKTNLLAGFGVVNVLLTGGLALLNMSGIWFAVKEAAFPLLLALFVLGSAYTQKPFFEQLVMHSSLLNWKAIEQHTPLDVLKPQLKKLFKQSTVWFSYSFFMSAVLNFVLAVYIFSDLNPGLSDESSKIILNKKIADMTWLGFVIIGLPCGLFAVGIFWRFLKQLSSLTKLPIEELLPSGAGKKKPKA